MAHSVSQYFNVSFLAGTVTMMGALAVQDVDFDQKGSALLGGVYQQNVEADFKSKVPLRDLSRDAWNVFQFAVFDQTNTDVIHTDDKWLFTAEEFAPAATGFDFSSELDWVRNVLADANVALLPIIVPDKARIYSDKLPYARNRELEARYDLALRVLSESDLPALDLRPVLEDLRLQGEAFLRTDTHWTPAGAEAVAKAINGLGFDLGAPIEVQTVWGAVESYEGDLLTFVEMGDILPNFGFGHDLMADVQTQAVDNAMSLFGDVEIPVALVGTSYSAKSEFNFDGFLKQHLRADVLNAAQSGRGPFEPMRDYLVSEDFQSTPPKLVIWEIPERYIATKDMFQ